jgi:hypothetical protein
MVEHHLLLGPLDDLLLDAGLGDEAVHVHLLLLPDPVGAGLSLNQNGKHMFGISWFVDLDPMDS